MRRLPHQVAWSLVARQIASQVQSVPVSMAEPLYNEREIGIVQRFPVKQVYAGEEPTMQPSPSATALRALWAWQARAGALTLAGEETS